MVEKKVTRILLWTTPRSCSTAFTRTFMNRNDTWVLVEPYCSPYYYGSDRVSTRYQQEPVKDGCTYKDVKAEHEAPCQGYDVLFSKALGKCIPDNRRNSEYLPRDFIHIFLIRQPRKSVASLYRLSTAKKFTGWDEFRASDFGFVELYNMFRYVVDELKEPTIVVDADDFQNNPESILKQYCQRCGVDFQDRMLHWSDDPKDHPWFSEWAAAWYDVVAQSRSVLNPEEVKCASQAPLFEDLPQEVREVADQAQPYYEKMRVFRLMPNE